MTDEAAAPVTPATISFDVDPAKAENVRKLKAGADAAKAEHDKLRKSQVAKRAATRKEHSKLLAASAKVLVAAERAYFKAFRGARI